LDHGKWIAASTTALSLIAPLANDAKRLARPWSSQGQGSARTFSGSCRGTAMISRAQGGTSSSMAATVTVSDFESVSRPTVDSRAMVLGGGICRRLAPLPFPAVAATFSCSWRSSGDSHDRRSASQMFAQKRPTVSLSSVELTSDVGVRANPRIGVLAMMESTWAFCRSL
jgi:hypothetical protein